MRPTGSPMQINGLIRERERERHVAKNWRPEQNKIKNQTNKGTKNGKRNFIVRSTGKWFRMQITVCKLARPPPPLSGAAAAAAEFYLVLPIFYSDLPSFTRLHWVLMKVHQVILGFTGFYLVLSSFTWFHWVLFQVNQVLLGFTEFYMVSQGSY